MGDGFSRGLLTWMGRKRGNQQPKGGPDFVPDRHFREHMDNLPTLPKATAEEVSLLAELLVKSSGGLLSFHGAKALAYPALQQWRARVLQAGGKESQ